MEKQLANKELFYYYSCWRAQNGEGIKFNYLGSFH